MKRVLVFTAFTVVILPLNTHAFCFDEAGAMYGINPQLLWAIAKVESDFNPTAINYNRNGNYDYGLMQINSWWYDRIGRELWTQLSDPCVNAKVGAWILAQCIQKHAYTWEAVGCYNAASKSKREEYANKVYRILSNQQSSEERPHALAVGASQE